MLPYYQSLTPLFQRGGLVVPHSRLWWSFTCSPIDINRLRYISKLALQSPPFEKGGQGGICF